jgi:N-acetylgalactosamine-6-sulfatase
MHHYLGNVYAMDLNVKSVLDVLDELGLAENTVVVFSSDQGPQRPYGIGLRATGPNVKKHPGTTRDGTPRTRDPNAQNMLGDTGVFRGNKGTVYDGGLRVPLIIRWPGKVKANCVDTENVIGGIDWLPSICKLAGVKDIPTDLDGEDVSDIWLGATRERTKPLLWKGGENPGTTIREGKWKCYVIEKRGKETGRLELYDILKNPAETKNLALKYPEVAERLSTKIRAWKAELPKSVESTGKYKHQY